LAGKLGSPLSGKMSNGFAGIGSVKSKIVMGATVIALVPFLMSTFAANVTVGSGALEFGQGSQQAIACDPVDYVSHGEEWFSQPAANDPSAGFFRVKALTVSDLDLESCRGKKLRVRLISTVGQELAIGPSVDANVLQITVPDVDGQVSSSDPTYLGLTYLTGDGAPLSGTTAASVSMSISGTSVYDGSNLSNTGADVTFYLDPTATLVNIDGQAVGRTTVETVNNPKRIS
jgi:hypothetical protein